MMNENFLLVFGVASKKPILLGEPDYAFTPAKSHTVVNPYAASLNITTWAAGIVFSNDNSRIYHTIPDDTGQISFQDITGDTLGSVGFSPWNGPGYALSMLSNTDKTMVAMSGGHFMFAGNIFNSSDTKVFFGEEEAKRFAFYQSMTDDCKKLVLSHGGPTYHGNTTRSFEVPASPIWIYDINENHNAVNVEQIFHPVTGEPIYGVAGISGDGNTLVINAGGAVYVMRKIAGNWSLVQTISTGLTFGPNTGRNAGDVKVNMNGSMFVFASPNEGKIRVMRETHEGWVQIQEFTGASGYTSQFGRRMAASRNLGVLAICNINSRYIEVFNLNYETEQYSRSHIEVEYNTKSYGTNAAVSRDGRFVALAGVNVPLKIYYS